MKTGWVDYSWNAHIGLCLHLFLLVKLTWHHSYGNRLTHTLPCSWHNMIRWHSVQSHRVPQSYISPGDARPISWQTCGGFSVYRSRATTYKGCRRSDSCEDCEELKNVWLFNFEKHDVSRTFTASKSMSNDRINVCQLLMASACSKVNCNC